MAGIWQEVLGLERVGVDEQFFELGGHSLLATQVFSRTREVFKVELPFRLIFEHPTLAAFTKAVEEAVAQGGTAEAEPKATPIKPVSRERHRMHVSAKGSVINPQTSKDSKD
jgi:acyl carrier protein